MASKIKTIGVLTSGGDAPGMNAAIRAVVRMAINKGIKVKGIYQGYKGLLNEEIIDLDARSVSDTISKGGTFLYTARSMEFRTPEGQQRAADNCRKNGIEGLVVIGGDDDTHQRLLGGSVDHLSCHCLTVLLCCHRHGYEQQNSGYDIFLHCSSDLEVLGLR